MTSTNRRAPAWITEESIGRNLAVVGVLVMVLVPVSRWWESPETEWPSRPIELVVFAGAGGGTDAACRTLAAAMEEDLGVPIRVANMTGGRGGAAAQYVYGRQHDGYRWMGVSETMLSLATRGGHFTTSEHWHYFVFTGSPGVISVAADAPFGSFEEVLEKVQAGKRLTIAASGRGSIWHLRTELLIRSADFDVQFIPYDGSGPSHVATLSGEVDLVQTALAEQMSLIEGGQLRPLVAVEPEALEVPVVGIIPAITEFFPELEEHLPLPQWLGLQVPQGVPADVRHQITKAYHNALDSPTVERFVDYTHNQVYGLSGKEALLQVQRLERTLNWMMYELGLVQIRPDEVGIARP